jgi:uncharacterized protein (DUF58 family)
VSGAVAHRLERWAAGWARRRQGPDALAVVLRRRRIYILPTPFGAAFGTMVFAMLLGSLNYGASLGFALTFLLGGLGLVAMHHCHNNLLGLKLRFAGAAPVFAGDSVVFRIAAGNESSSPRYDIELNFGRHGAAPIDVAPGGTAAAQLLVPTQRRGWVVLDRFAVSTRYPGRLFRAWTWVHMDARCLVYPQPARPGRPLPSSSGSDGTGKPDSGDADFAGLRSAAPGDPPQRIAWKAYARTELLLLKQFAGGDAEPCMVDWDALPELAPEARLSQLARWCLDAAEGSRAFGLRLPGCSLPIAQGPRHLAECLERLALFEVASQ